ncbi:MAG: hypothetical protein E6H02_10090 [Bacillati bacterium ANGP1]|uniref:Uncharacterized protein n=1 Tax=Candidatus Segetimicrobium genomatis TaxID=2569760 RepID=A0A537LK37_9BACT|nr:MAG: hypothetical protein E6H02_10090 [Terrabacteria group bacterium ANGP1]
MLMPMATLVRWLALWATAVLIGGFVLDLLVLPRDAGELAGAHRRLRRWISIAVVLLMIAWAGELMIRATVMSGSVTSARSAEPPGRAPRVSSWRRPSGSRPP